ncbi:RNase adapter RapZ [Sphingomonas morindae]|uniref:RNase adapter RapZ n=1 Tax=Sphingomonas morindae TaxID=1541170 RepID=A0ABY4X8A0_9SPHN|nr:RNase adapter RapZ [Sphingomonas morindae]USI73168.1 RNase adapter RapZ [Sphingomonas morindae]
MSQTAPRLLLVTGLSGAGKSTALRTLEDGGWEVVDNLPLSLLDRLLDAPAAPAGGEDRPLALGIDTRTRGFDPQAIVRRIAERRARGDAADILFLDCTGAVLVRRFSETRRRHPLAPDRPATDGIARERALLEPLRRAADHLIDTSDTTSNDLQRLMRARFAPPDGGATLTLLSFSYARGVPREADLVFDMRFLRNPHWDPALRPRTGCDPAVAAYIAEDPLYSESLERIVGLLLLLLPRYAAEGKSYVTIAFGCTGGKHRSVHSAEHVAQRLRATGFSPTILHRDLAAQASGGRRKEDADAATRASGD